MSTLKTRSYSLAISILFLASLLAAGCDKAKQANEPLPPQVAQLLRETVEIKTLPASLKDQKELQKAWNEMHGFYEKRGFQPVWSSSRGLRPQAEELIQAIPPCSRRSRRRRTSTIPRPSAGWWTLTWS
jgi:hypothetical protein